MKNFNLNRFGLALKCQFMTTRYQWLRIFGIYTLVLFIIEIFFTHLNGTSYGYMATNYTNDMEWIQNWYTRKINDACQFGVIFLLMAQLFGACYIFKNLKETRQRTTYLMWPVSNLEKYLVGVLLNIVMMTVGTILVFMLADTLRLLLDWIEGHVIVSGIPIFFDKLGTLFFSTSKHWQANVFSLGSYIWLVSVFALGGSLFRRNQFLLTSFSLITLFFLFVWLAQEAVDLWSNSKSVSLNIMSETNGVFQVHWSYYVLMTILLLLTVTNFWLAYRISCRMQVINNKWLNV